VFISDAKGGQIASNAAFQAVWGDSPEKTGCWQEYEKFVGFDSQSGRRLGAEDWGLAVALRTGQTVKQELDIVTFTGERKMIINKAGPLFDPTTGEISGGVAVVMDATETLTAFRKLKEETELRDIFIGVLGHDLRIPLSSIKLRSAMLLRSELDEGSIGFIRRILRSSERMERMISEILDFARARASKIPIVATPGDLWEICEEIVDECRQAHPRRKVLFVAQGNGLGSWDRDRLTQVLGNLIGNAIAYSPPETDVRVHADNSVTSALRIEVHNTGNPIPPEQQPLIFEPFRRAAAQGVNCGGLGLGLYIAKQIVESHGGKITLTSTAEEGTSFVVELPRQPPQQAHPDADATVSPHPAPRQDPGGNE
jgi:signal transduction histidine kinase